MSHRPRHALRMFVAVVCLHQQAAWAAIVVDGTAEAEYGPAVSTQNTNTGFGNHDGVNKGSELDQAFGRVQNGKLYLTFAGNLEDNFNKLVDQIRSATTLRGLRFLTSTISQGISSSSSACRKSPRAFWSAPARWQLAAWRAATRAGNASGPRA